MLTIKETARDLNMSEELWTVREIAKWLVVSQADVRDDLLTIPGFPPPAAPDKWLASEVRKFVLTGKAAAADTALYRHFGRDGVLLYVGISLSPVARTKTHGRMAPWFRDVVRIEIEWHKTYAEAQAAEKRAIQEERPVHNRMHAIRE